MNKKLLQQTLGCLKIAKADADNHFIVSKQDSEIFGYVIADLEKELAKPKQEFYPDWDMIKPFHERIKELEAQLVLAKPEQKYDHVSDAMDVLSDVNADLIRDAKPEQEPVSHLWECIGRWSAYLAANGKQGNLAPPTWLVDAVKAATAPPRKPWQEPVGQFVGGIPEVSQQREWVGLTDEEIENLMNATGIFGGLTPDEIALARLIEAKLKELNT